MQGTSVNRRSSSAGLSRPGRLALMAGGGLLLFILLGLLGIVQALELMVYDLRFRARGERPPDAPIVIVAINDESFSALDRNLRTWPRAEYARLIDAIAAGDPAVIGVDVAWTHPGADAGGDGALARSLERANPVILAGLVEHQEGVGYEYERYTGPIEPLAQAADGVGLVNMALDADGVVRRVAPRQFHNGVWYPAFGYAVTKAYGGYPVSKAYGGVLTWSSDEGASDLLINFRGGPNTFHTVPMYQVLNGEVPASTFEDQIVLIGFTTVLEQDLHITPFDREGLTPGVEVHANVVATLLNDDPSHYEGKHSGSLSYYEGKHGGSIRHYEGKHSGSISHYEGKHSGSIRRTPVWLRGVLGLAAVALTALAFWRLRPIHAAAAVGGGVLIYEATTFALFARAGLWLPAVSPVILASLTTLGGLAERVLVEEREKRRIRDRFESFMAPERLAAVLNRWEELAAEDRPEVEATVLFSDIRGFTSATETLTRQGRGGEVMRFLNRYTDAMVEAIFTEHGVLDKMLGDGLLVLFGAPQPAPDHALQAVRAALRMRALMSEMNALWPLRDRRPLRIGIGIHSGPLMDGIVGRGRRVEYTVIGDVVNTASRVEDYTKEVLARRIERAGDDGQPDATILITEATYAQVRGRVRVDADVPPLQAKGKAQPIRVYRVLGLLEGGEKEG